MITDLKFNKKVHCTELFTLRSLIYEIYIIKAPFESLKDSDIQTQYCCAQFLNVTHLLQWFIILSCWSVEFVRELYTILSKWQFTLLYLSLPQTLRFKSNYLITVTDCCGAEGKFKCFNHTASIYISAHLFHFRFQCAGTAVRIAAAVAVLVLEAAGFKALSSVVSSSAAVWQASIEAVKAGSLFAWCQSAAIRDAAVNEIIAAEVTEGEMLLSSTAADVLMNEVMNKENEKKLMKLFQKMCRRSDRLEEKLI